MKRYAALFLPFLLLAKCYIFNVNADEKNTDEIEIGDINDEKDLSTDIQECNDSSVHDYIEQEEISLNEYAETEMMDMKEGIIDSGKIGDTAYWELYENRVLKITGTGKISLMPRESGLEMHAYDIDTINVGEGITIIGDCAFDGIKAKEINLPNSLEKIGYRSIVKEWEKLLKQANQ